MEELTQAEKNILKDYIETDSGKKLIMKLVNQELNLIGEAYLHKTTSEQQIHNVNQSAGIYWVRTLVQDLITVPKTPPKKK